MSETHWPDALLPPQPKHIQTLLDTFWTELTLLAEYLPREQFLLASELLFGLRQVILQLMLALNGIQRPNTSDLNIYLSESQRIALEKTLLLPSIERKHFADAWIGQAVSLVVIYRWYAPQLVAKYGVHYPHVLEKQSLETLVRRLSTWPQSITTE